MKIKAIRISGAIFLSRSLQSSLLYLEYMTCLPVQLLRFVVGYNVKHTIKVQLTEKIALNGKFLVID